MADQQRDITATIKSKAEKPSVNGPFWSFELIEAGQERAYSWSLFDFESGKEVGVGETWMFRVSTKPNGKGGVYRNVDGVLDKIDGAVATGASQGYAAPSEGDRGRSIERQVALKAAVELAGYNITKGTEVSSGNIINVAKGFARFLRSEE